MADLCRAANCRKRPTCGLFCKKIYTKTSDM